MCRNIRTLHNFDPPAADEEGRAAALQFVRAAAGVVRRADGRFLVARRAAHKAWGGWWEFPGGRIEADESEAACIERELLEELALRVRVLRPLVTGLHPPEEGLRIVVTAHLAELRAGTPAGPDHSQVRWLRASELANLTLLPADRVIAEVLEELTCRD